MVFTALLYSRQIKPRAQLRPRTKTSRHAFDASRQISVQVVGATWPNHPLSRRDVPFSVSIWKDPVDGAQGRHLTRSQAESSSTPETIEDQRRSGGPLRALSLNGGTRGVRSFALPTMARWSRLVNHQRQIPSGSVTSRYGCLPQPNRPASATPSRLSMARHIPFGGLTTPTKWRDASRPVS